MEDGIDDNSWLLLANIITIKLDHHDNQRDQQGDGYQVLMEDGSLEGSGEELIANATLVNIIIIIIVMIIMIVVIIIIIIVIMIVMIIMIIIIVITMITIVMIMTIVTTTLVNIMIY